MRIFFLLGLLLNITISVSGRQKVYDFNTRCQQAYDAIMQLRLDAGAALLAEEKKAHPDNLIPYFLENYADFFTLFFNEDPTEYAQKKSLKAERVAWMEEGPANSPYYLYTQAAIRFQWGMVRLKFNERWDAVWEIRKAYQLLKENQKKFPQFLPNNMLLGSMQTVFGTIPEGYRWLSNTLGMKGTIKEGMQMVQQVIDSNTEVARLFKEEACYYYCYLKLFVENKPEDVWAFLQKHQLDTKNNYLFALMVANIAMNNQKASLGIKVLTERNDNAQYEEIPYVYYVLGQLKLCRQDEDANVYLQKFIDRFKGKFYLKEGLQRLSWYYYLRGNMDAANKYRSQILTRGNTETDADKQALKDAKSGRWPNQLLLKARLLSDGGFFPEALKLLQTKKPADFPIMEEKLEYAYRLGRIYDEMGQDDNAITMYEATVKAGANRTEHFAARASLQMGYIYEKRNDKTRARQCYQACLDMKGHDYKNSLDQRAKAGIQRLNGA
ncbi:tetratricopeptide repeat protein [Chitinophaga pinensis]|uniref:Tetratricopeptide repeat protein n=1 Tax=Chitinophaga pinensis TaxID=79329 RepID=A0A5C6LX43_9BACT|nr:tetratricopeptide repeat protein [Chitinophaga pinensis]TWW02015.1 tetratricopeptide repeat protein [Chitinophaga pinensis]